MQPPIANNAVPAPSTSPQALDHSSSSADENDEGSDNKPNIAYSQSHAHRNNSSGASSAKTIKPSAHPPSSAKPPAPSRSGSVSNVVSSSIKRMFRSGDGTPKSGATTPALAISTATANGNHTVPGTANGGNAPGVNHHRHERSSLVTPGGLALTNAHLDSHLKKSSRSSASGKDSPPPTPTPASSTIAPTMMTSNGSTKSSSTSVSPASTLPTPSSEHADDYFVNRVIPGVHHSSTLGISHSPDHSRPGSVGDKSNPGSRKSSFSGSTTPHISKALAHTSEARSDVEAAGQRAAFRDAVATAVKPPLTRRISGGSATSKKTKSDASSEHRHETRSVAGSNASGTSLQQKYGVCEKIAIGKGATSVVRLAHKWDQTQEKLYAVKEFRKRRNNETEREYVKKLTSEFCISSTLHHINVVETVDLVQDEGLRWCEVMEYCPGGDLYAAIKKGSMSLSEIECCFKQILKGVSYLHSQGVAHRDLKPENLYFDTRGHLKIGDYGASTVYRLPWEATVHMSTGLCGSEPYIAPEQFNRKPYDARLVDIWAIGIVYYCLLNQELPWRVAQQSDPLFASYQASCSAAPFRASVAGAGLGPALPNEKAGTKSAIAATHSFPQMLNNIEPREARPVLRRMLEPDPRYRVSSADEILNTNTWMGSVEVCTEVKKPKHQHSNIRAALSQTVNAMPAGANGVD